MTCCNIINTPKVIDYANLNQQKVVCERDTGEIELVFQIYPGQMSYLTIHVISNYLFYDPERFRIYNHVDHVFETPIGNGYILMKEWYYDIYDRDEIILSLCPSSEVYVLSR